MIAGAPPPDQDALAARRAEARRARELHEAAVRAWGESLPNADPVPYRSIDELSRDVERVGSDPTAIGRLLRSVDGDALEPRCLRALASLCDALVPMAEAALPRSAVRPRMRAPCSESRPPACMSRFPP